MITVHLLHRIPPSCVKSVGWPWRIPEAPFFGQRSGGSLCAGRHGNMVEESGTLMRRLVTAVIFSEQRSAARHRRGLGSAAPKAATALSAKKTELKTARSVAQATVEQNSDRA